MNPFLRMQGPTLEADTARAIDCIIALAHYGIPGRPLSIVKARAFPAWGRLDFFIDNSDRRSYACRKHKKAIYLLALPFGLPSDRYPKRDFRSGRKESSVGPR